MLSSPEALEQLSWNWHYPDGQLHSKWQRIESNTFRRQRILLGYHVTQFLSKILSISWLINKVICLKSKMKSGIYLPRTLPHNASMPTAKDFKSGETDLKKMRRSSKVSLDEEHWNKWILEGRQKNKIVNIGWKSHFLKFVFLFLSFFRFFLFFLFLFSFISFSLDLSFSRGKS